MNKIYYERPKQPQNQKRSQRQNNQEKYYNRASVNFTNQNDEYRDGDFTEQSESPYMSAQEQETQYYQPSYEAPVYASARDAEVKNNSAVKDWIANGVLIVLTLSLVISIVVLISDIRYMTYDYSKSASTFWYEINEGQYADTVKSRHDNEAGGVFETPELKECYAVADYFEAASFYKVAAHTGNTADMEKYLAVMKEAYKLFGDVSYLAEDINTKLGLEISLE